MQWTSAPNIGQAPLPQRARGYWKAWPITAYGAAERFLEDERAQLPLWAVAAFLAGIALWFAVPLRTQWQALIAVAGGMAILGFFVIPGRSGRALGWLALMVGLGCALVWGRSAWVAHSVLDRPMVVSLTGAVERMEVLTARGAIRLTLAPAEPNLPRRVRVSIPDDKPPRGLGPGATVTMRARLAPPPPMALPGTYDFARDAWFKGIGAVGKSLGNVTVTVPAPGGGLDGAREALRRHIAGRVDASARGIAIALVTGDQNGVGEEEAEAMRRSGLTHLLSVSGLHIAAVVGFVMVAALRVLALFPFLALRFNLVLVAAAAAAVAGIGYTMLTGMQVPTVRSCVAALLILAGIALGRDAISMRLVAAGAFVVLLFRPESAAGASFQMSFAAAMAIVVLHSANWSKRWFARRDEGIAMRLARFIGALAATGLAVEVALIPLALYHFHRAGLYGVAANIVAIPLTTFVIMPAEGLALLFDLAGLGAPMWWLVELSIHVLLWIAYRVAAASGAVAALPSMPVWAFASMIVGGFWLCLWEGRVRRFGLVGVAAGALAALLNPVPDMLVSGDGRHLAIVGDDGRPALLRSRTGDYMRDTLSEAAGYDGDGVDLEAQWFGRCSADACVASIARDGREWRLLATRSRHLLAWRPFVRACADSDIAVSDRRLPPACAPRWLKLDRPFLGRTGGLTIHLGDKPSVVSVAERVGEHPWGIAMRQ